VGREAEHEKQKVIATFEDEAQASRAARDARPEGSGASVGAKEDEVTALQAEMQDESETIVAAPGNIGPFTTEMLKGLLVGTGAGVAVGVLLGLLIGLLPLGGLADLALGTRLVIGALCGAAAGATAGFVGGGGAKPELEGEGRAMSAEQGTTVAVEVDDAEQARQTASRLGQAGPRRVDRIDDKGRPIERSG
jgi:hypothetical protein